MLILNSKYNFVSRKVDDMDDEYYSCYIELCGWFLNGKENSAVDKRRCCRGINYVDSGQVYKILNSAAPLSVSPSLIW